MSDEWYTKVYENKHNCINEFVRQKRATGRSDRTLNRYSRVLQKFYHSHFPRLSPGETEVGHVEEYLVRLNQRGLSQNTKRGYLEALSSFFSWAVKRPRYEEITGNPAGVVLEEIPRVVRDRPDCATWENAEKIVRGIADPRNKAVAVILAKTGCRLSEALEIELDDLMLEKGLIRLRKRKGGVESVVPVDEEVVKTVDRFRTIRSTEASDHLFVSIRGNRLSRERVRKAVRESAVECGVMERGEIRFGRKFTPHTFRTVFTTLMRRRGMDDRVLRYIRGDSCREIIDLYTRVDREEVCRQYLECVESLRL